MNHLLILGTDTDVGKTTFALLYLAAFPTRWEYWKPVESGASDSQLVQRLLPEVHVHPPVKRVPQPLAPPLAARLAGEVIPSPAALAAACPTPTVPQRSLLIETFGSPFSPLTDTDLQLRLVERLPAAKVLVSSSRLGAIGRTLACLEALDRYGQLPQIVVLLGPRDDYAAEQIGRHGRGVPVLSLEMPASWDTAGIRQAAEAQRATLEQVVVLATPPALRFAVEDRTAVLHAQDRALLWHPYTSLREADPPLACVAAQDEFLWLADGRRVIDAISSWWTILHGHRHPVLMQALHRASQEIDHVLFAGVTHPWAVALAERLLATAPWQGGRVFYSDNGSTAVEVALKMAYQFWCHRGEPQRTLFIGFEHGYHGDTFGAMSASRDPVFFGWFEPLLFRSQILPLDAGALEETLRRHRGEVAAIILEPLVQGAGGMRLHAPALLRDLAAVAAQQQVLFIADEVLTGGGRFGLLWTHQEAGVVPDLICAAKTLTGGILPLAATLAAPHIVAAFDSDDRRRTFFHGHSYTAHPLACAVALANWELLPQVIPAAPRRLEAFWQQALEPLRRLPQVRDLRIKGSLAAIELNAPGGYLAEVGRHLRRFCLQQGVFLRPLGNVLYALPPLGIADSSLEQLAEVLRRAVASCQQFI
jgi:adenosylmethionine-8-amino-7-oxononanoate aminotransferase